MKQRLEKFNRGIKQRRGILTTARFILLSYIIIIAIGALLLSLPFARTAGTFYNPLDAIFDATSAVCVTGFLLCEISTQYTLFGQIVILILIQVGGLGFMSIATLVFVVLGKRISLQNSLATTESIGEDNDFGQVRNIIRKIALLAFVVEAIGFLVLLPVLVPEFGSKGIYYSLFLSVSAFTNAGVSILPDTYSFNYLLMTVLMLLTLIGGLGYIVVFDIIRRIAPDFKKKRKLEGLRRLGTHTKIVLAATLALTLSSTISFTIGEYNNAFADKGFFDSVFSALFISVNARSSGFATYDYTQFTEGSRLILMLNMFVGASPASTGGGIRTTTAFIIFAYFISTIRRKQHLTVFNQTISKKHITKAINVFLFSAVIALVATIILLYSMPMYTLGDIMFEVISSLSTTGKTVGVIADKNVISEIVFILLMIIGRVGILTFGMGFLGKDDETKIKYSEAKILIG